MGLPKTTASEKLLLAALGIGAALLLIELGMRTAGSLLSAAKDRARQAGAGGSVILCLGESTTEPVPLNDHSWPRQMQQVLESEGAAVRVVNEGLGGTTSAEIAARLPGLLERHRPDAVVAMVGINDPEWYGTRAAGRWGGLRLGKAAAYFLHELAAPAPPRDLESTAGPNLQRIAFLLRERGIPLVAMQYPLADVEELRAVLEPFPGTIFVDNKPSFSAAMKGARYEELFTDRFALRSGAVWGHCTPRGNRLIAENAAAAVAAVLERRREQAPRPAAAAGLAEELRLMRAAAGRPEQALAHADRAVLLSAGAGSAELAALYAGRAGVLLRLGRPGQARLDLLRSLEHRATTQALDLLEGAIEGESFETADRAFAVAQRAAAGGPLEGEVRTRRARLASRSRR